MINTDQFVELKQDPTKTTETKVQRLIRDLKKKKYVTESDCKEIYPSSSRPGLFYGTAKVHKLKENDTVENLPLRPIISNVGTATYKTAKYLAKLLSPLATSTYNVKNNSEFIKSIRNAKIPKGYKMISFDVKSLFTNVPLEKTIDIIIRKIYQEKKINTNIPKEHMRTLLYLCTKHVHFSYEGILYMQVNGVAMGSPLGPVIANIFMSELETITIPLLDKIVQNWKRYVDDTFAFVIQDKIEYVLDKLNSFDENIQFTYEIENENKIPFLDVLIIRNSDDSLSTTVYRKPTNTDLYINWKSHSPIEWKKTTANILIQRAVNICSNKELLDKELEKIEYSLCNINGYPKKFVKDIIKYNIYKNNHHTQPVNENNNVTKEIYINLKYAGHKGERLMRKMKKIVDQSLEEGTKSKVVFNATKLHQYFNVKDPVPNKYKSDLIYECSCPHEECNETYLGETERRFEERVIEHNNRDKKSHMYKHCKSKNHPHVWWDNFIFLDNNYGTKIKRRIGEALLINERKPSLNKQENSFPLKLFN